MTEKTQLTMLMNQWRTGDEKLLGDIIPAVYQELHRVAKSYMRNQPKHHTLQATALINEAFLRLNNVDKQLENRGHFIGIIARLMRDVLVDYARAKGSLKRGGNLLKQELEDIDAVVPAASIDVLALESVLEKLADKEPRSVQIAELHYFCGLTLNETAQMLEISEATVSREIRMLKSVLSTKLADA